MKPLPEWRQWWRRTRAERKKAYAILRIVGAKALAVAISVAAATLVSFGVWSIYAPAGYVVGGMLIWVLQWSHEQDKGRQA